MIKRKVSKVVGLWICLVTILSSCLNAQEAVPSKAEFLKDKKVLIVYLSRTKNTKTIAEIIRQQVKGDIVALELQQPYPENYQQIVAQVAKENEQGILPTILTKIDSIEKYDVVFLGFPTWGMQLPPPFKSFLTQNKFKRKTVIPFNTNAGYGVGSSFNTVKELLPNSKVLEGFTIKGGIEKDGILFVMDGEMKIEAEQKVKEWLNKISLSK